MSIVQDSIHDTRTGLTTFCKFLSANDTGDTGAHQSGIYVPKSAASILFDTPGTRGENKEKSIIIKWQNDFETESRFIYYGTATRNEYRITRFGRGFSLLNPEHTGDLFVLIKLSSDYYHGYVLSTDDEINGFLDEFSLSPANTGKIIQTGSDQHNRTADHYFSEFIESLSVEFPSSQEMSGAARSIFFKLFNNKYDETESPDHCIVTWTELEYGLFRALESIRYEDILKNGFATIDQFIESANSILNRRKSRAGKSLENHLSAIFSANSLKFESQPLTEGTKRPDFLFPGGDYYRDLMWSAEKLVFLGAKTTCKDRWRQILNEANRISTKHLFTLQQGISSSQLHEMTAEHVVLVVPELYRNSYPANYRDKILSLGEFIAYAKEKTN